jgi:endonuclease/exonuclease/phosphatase family metal-dependent hydrolase
MKLVSYNIQYGVGKDDAVDLPRIAGEIGDADIIALQEVERYNSETGMTDQVAELAELFPEHHWVYGPGLDLDASFHDDNNKLVNRRRQFGNMLLSKTPIISSRNHLLPRLAMVEQLTLQRSMIEGVIDCELGLIRVYSVHLGHSSAQERENQIAYLMDTLHDAPAQGGAWAGKQAPPHWRADGASEPPMPHPAIFMGDFNLTPAFAEYELLAGRMDAWYGRATPLNGLIDAWVGCGHSSDATDGITCPHDDKGAMRIDYAWISTDLAPALKSMRVGVDAVGSDHQPIFVEISPP